MQILAGGKTLFDNKKKILKTSASNIANTKQFDKKAKNIELNIANAEHYLIRKKNIEHCKYETLFDKKEKY